MLKQALQIIADGCKDKAVIALELSKTEPKKKQYWKGQHDAYLEDVKMIEKCLENTKMN